MFHTRDWAVYGVAVYLGLLFGGAVIAPRTAWTFGGDAQPHHDAAPPMIEFESTAEVRAGDPGRVSSRAAPFDPHLHRDIKETRQPPASPEA
ncbi:MAG: hypothetical protein ACOC3G_08990 [Phycisphaeraceae bacterium]